MHSSEVLDTLREIHQTQSHLLAAVESLSERLGSASPSTSPFMSEKPQLQTNEVSKTPPNDSSEIAIRSNSSGGEILQAPKPSSPGQQTVFTSRIILTYENFTTTNMIVFVNAKHTRTYPKQLGINPLPMDWGNFDPIKRGPVVVSRLPSTIRRRNGS